jgi:Tol biopolymer transport system component
VIFVSPPRLFLVDAAGQNLRQLRTGFQQNHVPTWSADGSWILFEARDHGPFGPWGVYRIAAAGGTPEALAVFPDSSAIVPALSRDDRWLAYLLRDTLNAHQWLVVRDLQTGAVRRLTDSAFGGVSPRWTPDAAALLLLDADLNTPVEWGIWRLDLVSSTYSYLGPAKGNASVEVSPDGHSLLFGSDTLWMADSNAQHPRILLASPTLVYHDATWTPATPQPVQRANQRMHQSGRGRRMPQADTTGRRGVGSQNKPRPRR